MLEIKTYIQGKVEAIYNDQTLLISTGRNDKVILNVECEDDIFPWIKLDMELILFVKKDDYKFFYQIKKDSVIPVPPDDFNDIVKVKNYYNSLKKYFG